MLVYHNGDHLRILLQIHGSVLHRAATLALLVALITSAYGWWVKENGAVPGLFVGRTWAADLAGSTVGIAVVFRTTMAWTRLWEAASFVQMMFAKWLLAYGQLISFLNTAEKLQRQRPPEDAEEVQEMLDSLLDYRQRLTHNFSLMSAVAVHRLTHGDLNRMRRRSEKYASARRWSASICLFCHLRRHWTALLVHRSALRDNDITRPFDPPLFEAAELEGPSKVKRKMQRKVPSSTIQTLLSGTSVGKKKEAAPTARPGLRKMGSIYEVTVNNSVPSSLPSSRSNSQTFYMASNVTWSSDLVVLGEVTVEEMELLEGEYRPNDDYFCAIDRVQMVSEWIWEDVNQLRHLVPLDPVILCSPLSDVSDGVMGQHQAARIADVPFPFPFSQLLELLSVCFTFVIPFYSVVFTSGPIASPIAAFAVTFAFWSLNNISFELETPFADGPNQLPVIAMHERFVEVMRSMYAAKRQRVARGARHESSELSNLRSTGMEETAPTVFKHNVKRESI